MTPEVEARYHQMLGAYVAKTTRIESRIDQIVATFFNVASPLKFSFECWVMGRLEFGMKLKVLDRIWETLHEKPKFKDLRSGLTKMMERRNELAHGHYQQTIVFDGAGGQEPGELVRRSRDAKHHDGLNQMPSLDLDELAAELADLDNLDGPLTELFSMAFELWPYEEDSGGVKTSHPGNFREMMARPRPDHSSSKR